MLIKALGNNILAFLKKHFLPYLVKQDPVEENGVTLVLDEGVDRQADRPYLWKRCLEFTGSDLIEYPIAEKTNQEDYSYVAWVKLDATGFPTLCSKNNFIDPNYNSRFILQISKAKAYCYAGNTSANTYWDLSTLNLTDDWHFVVCTYDSSQTGAEGRLWIDGVEIQSTTYFGNTTSATTYNTITIGAFYNGGTAASGYWNGKLKYFASYDYAISDSVLDNNTNIDNLPIDYEVNGVFEEGDGTTVYASDGTEGTITTSNIDLVRVEQEDAPLLLNSGDVVGWSNVSYGYFNKNANNVASADVSDLEIDDFVLSFYFRKDGNDGATQGICGIQSQTRATLGQSGYFIQTNTSNSLNIVFRKIGGGTETIPMGTVLQSEKWNHVVIYKNGTDFNYFLNGVSGNATLTFSEIDWTSTSKLTSFGGYATNTFSFTEGQVSVTQFQLGEYSTANVNAALAQETLPSLIADIPFSDGSGTTLTNNEGTNLAITVDDIEDFWKKQYSPSNGVTDVIFNRPLTHTGRKDFPLTPYQEPAYKGTSTDYATLESQIILNGGETVEYGMLVTSFPVNATQGIVGFSISNNRFIAFESTAGNVILTWGADFIRFSTGLDFTEINQFFINVGYTRTDTTTITDCFLIVKTINGEELYSNTVASTTISNSYMTISLLRAAESSGKRSQYESPYIWRKLNGTVTNYWEYLGNDSLVIWDRVGGNHATITTSNITANQGTQDVYSSRLKDGYSESLYFRDGGQVAAANNTIQDETTGDFTLLSWVRVIRDSAESSIGDDQVIIGKGSIGAGNQYGYFMYLTNGALRGEMVYNGTRYPTDNDTGVDLDTDYLGQWLLAATTFDRSGNLTAKIVTPNGTVHSSTGKDISAQDGNSITNTNTFKLGSGFIFTDRELDGSIYQAAKFNSLLTESELSALHTAGLKHSFASNIGDYTSSGNLTGHWISPSGINDTWEDTQGTDDLTPTGLEKIIIPANLLNNGLDIFGNTLTYSSGVYLHSDIKLTSPAFRTLDTALQSNEELARDTTDANGNAVKDRLLTPISLGHSDKGFPCFVNTGAEVFTLGTHITIDDGSTYRFETLYNTYQDTSYGCMFGSSANDAHRIGSFHNNNFYLKAINTAINVDTGLDVSELTDFIYSTEFTRNGTNWENITLQLKNINNKILASHSPSNINGVTFPNIVDITACFSGNAAAKQTLGSFSWWKIYKNDVLIGFWVYTGNNSYLLQDKVGDNHGILTTADVSANQATQDVFNPLVDGYSLNSLIRESTLFSIGSTLGTGNDSTNDANGNPILEHTAVVSTTITYTNNDIEILRTVDGSYTNIFILTEIDGTRIDTSVIPIGTSVKMVIDADKGDTDRWYISDGGTGVGVGDTAYWWETSGEKTIEWIKIDDNTNGGIQIRARIPSDYVASTGTPFIIHSITLTINEKTLPQHPYNGLDIFDNTLTTPRSKERTKSLKYTDND